MGMVQPSPRFAERLLRRIYRKLAVLYLPAPQPDARRAYGSGPSQFGDLRLPSGPGPHPVLVTLHGGFWRAKYGLEHLGHLCAALTRLGLATWNLEYRRLGQPGGGWPGTFLDVWSGATYLESLAEEYPLDLNRVAVLGHSAGGHLALWLAAAYSGKTFTNQFDLAQPRRLQLLAAIALAGVSDLREAWKLELGNGVVADLLGGTPHDYPDRFVAASPVECLPLGIPQVLVHGCLDETVPFSLSKQYGETAASFGDPVQLVPLEGMGHFEPIDPRSAAWAAVSAAVLRVLH
jgi:acetyl esterase/lipase